MIARTLRSVNCSLLHCDLAVNHLLYYLVDVTKVVEDRVGHVLPVAVRHQIYE